MKLHEYTTLILGNHNDENGENCSPKNSEDLEVEDVKEYLSQEYNEDGTPRVLEGWPEIRAYENWYFRGMGSEEIEEYWGNLQELLIEHYVAYPNFTQGVVKDLSLNQIKELIKKEADPTYEIDDSVMGIN